MGELSKLYDKIVLCRKESCILGKIVNVFFDKKCKNIAYFVILPNISKHFDTQSLLAIAYDDILSFNDVLIIDSMLYASDISNVDTSVCIGNMIGKSIYTQNGKLKGAFVDVIVNDKGNVLRLMTRDKAYTSSAFWQIGEVAFLNSKTTVKNAAVKIMPKAVSDTIVSILDGSLNQSTNSSLYDFNHLANNAKLKQSINLDDSNKIDDFNGFYGLNDPFGNNKAEDSNKLNEINDVYDNPEFDDSNIHDNNSNDNTPEVETINENNTLMTESIAVNDTTEVETIAINDIFKTDNIDKNDTAHVEDMAVNDTTNIEDMAILDATKIVDEKLSTEDGQDGKMDIDSDNDNILTPEAENTAQRRVVLSPEKITTQPVPMVTDIPIIRIGQREPLFAKNVFNTYSKREDVSITSIAADIMPTSSICENSDSQHIRETDDCAKKTNTDHTPPRIICEYDFLLGRKLVGDLKSYMGEMLAPEGAIVDVELVEKARKCGKLVELTLSSK